MAIARATVERELLQEVGPYFRVCQLDSTTQDGSNVAMEGPIRLAIEACGGSVVDWPYVTDADIATITESASRLIYFSKYYCFDKCWGNWPHTDQSHGSESQSLDQLAKRLRERLAEYKEELKDPDIVPGGALIEIEAPESGKIEAGTFGHDAPPYPLGNWRSW